MGKKFCLLFLVLVSLILTCSAQGEEPVLPDSFLIKLNQSKIEFSLTGEIEKTPATKPTHRTIDLNTCEAVEGFMPEARAYIGKKKELKILYKIEYTPATLNEDRLKTYENYLPLAFGLYNSPFIEGLESGTEIAIIENITKDLNADKVEVTTFPVNENVQKCLKNNTCLHLMAYKKNHGYFNIMVFYNKEDYKDIKRVLATAIRSLKYLPENPN
ncbi:MAG: hypothetical protein K1X92_08715 [Bacteroidia bacterium]|nr:hypothetical protein [Bacteroidia bacterium]